MTVAQALTKNQRRYNYRLIEKLKQFNLKKHQLLNEMNANNSLVDKLTQDVVRLKKEIESLGCKNVQLINEVKECNNHMSSIVDQL